MPYCCHVVGDEEDGAAVGVGDGLHLADGFLLELGIAHGEDLVNNQNLRVKMSGYGKTEPDHHATGVALHRRVDVTLASAEIDDFIQFPGYFGFGHA